ncbi:hypothetical protein PGTUg99_023802 [Puccinia graminis f. sp. tritici]|uniref:Uncharacterized protein n=1 Tax=Puccinia graminis f. sp. tritici TaxID=56615 RepID=A0A5B0NP98_PUCGR|nr:hypothetical protein PGTUg99_029324 [Puccinia graminis f. sp. tritici]KAA1129290.1 hypothetical protein PGTUg99_023802 [Puccinia graminis f. sp. tritici]
MPGFPAPACVASAPRAFRISAASIPHAPNKPAKALAKARSRHHNGRESADYDAYR